MCSPSPPPAPDYAGAAQATAQGNKEAAIAAQAGNMINQYTPYGSVEYAVRGEQDGTPLWSQTVNLSPEQQAQFNQNQAINKQLGDVAQSGVGYVQQAMANPLQAQEIQRKLQDPQLLQQQTVDALYKANTQYLDPQFEQSEANLRNRLANQGITQGSEAYEREMGNLARQKQRAYESARNAAIGGGTQAAQGMFGMGLQGGTFANQAAAQQLAQEQALQQNPINMLNAVRTGQQMQTAQMPQVGTSSPGNLSNWSGPDLLSAATAQGQFDQGIYNAKSAANAQLMSSMIQAGGMLGGAAMKSDIRLKTNIVKIGIHKVLGIGLYTWDYIWGMPGAGVMAQELEKVLPEAVITMPDGFKAVNYGLVWRD